MKISVQMHSLREVGGFDAQLSLARQAGFEWVETVATHGLRPAEFAARLAAHGLGVSSMHVSLAALESDLDTVIEACRRSACPLIVMPWLPMGERPATPAGWAAMGQRLGAQGDRVRAEGLQLAYHNHDFEFLAYQGRAALEWLFEATTPAQLAWEADLGWVGRAGADPQHWLSRFADRLAAVHAKDIAPDGTAVDEDGWTALGRGILPWADLLARLRTSVGPVVFEHDHPADHLATLRTSHAYLVHHLR
jgi:sugar phosphate isomerase/epimerase